jgi:hypothetical protein
MKIQPIGTKTVLGNQPHFSHLVHDASNHIKMTAKATRKALVCRTDYVKRKKSRKLKLSLQVRVWIVEEKVGNRTVLYFFTIV